jgi:methanogenic corrinoid protein MtbC1
MNAPPINGFAAQLLERGAAGYAGYAAAALVDSAPRLRDLFGADALNGWRHNLTQRVLELAAALAAAEPRIFVSRVVWTSKAFRARQQDEAAVRLSLESLRAVLGERLPEAARAAPLAYLDQALDALRRPLSTEGPELDPGQPHDRLALRFLQKVLEGDGGEAIEEVLAATRNGLDLRTAYLEVLLPAQREIGRLWHHGEINIAEEHLVTSVTQRCMAALAATAPRPAARNGKTAVIAAVAGNVHDIGLRAVADFYQMAGWRTIFLGADVPADDLPAMLNYFQADLLLLGAMLSTHLPRVEQAIKTVRSTAEKQPKIIVGGAAFDEASDLWQRIGADGYASRVDDAVAMGARLVGA